MDDEMPEAWNRWLCMCGWLMCYVLSTAEHALPDGVHTATRFRDNVLYLTLSAEVTS